MAPLLAHTPGVDRAFERLYRRHAVDVYRYAVAVLRNQADAEDVTQTTFMNAYRALERGETPEAPHNWLIAIAHNVCRQRFRQASRRVQEVGLDDDVADHFVRPEDDDAPSPGDIKRALDQLAFNQRAALVMRELEGRSYAEIADLLDLSVSAVETLIFRARRALREQLEAALTCGQAEHLLSRQLDGELAKHERGQLRAHLRECADCRRLARSQRAQRSAFRALGAIPLPSSLASLFGGGASVGTAVAVKAAAVVISAGVVGGVAYDVHHQLTPPKAKPQQQQRMAVTPTTAAVQAHEPATAAVSQPATAPPARAHRHGGGTPPQHVQTPASLPAPAVVDQAPPTAPVRGPRHTGGGQSPSKSRPARAHGHGNSGSHGHAGVAPPVDGSAAPGGRRSPRRPADPGNSRKPGDSGKPHGHGGSPAVTVPSVPVTAPDPPMTLTTLTTPGS